MIYLIGTNHKKAEHDNKIKEYVLKASKNEIVVFLEGVPSDPQMTAEFIEQVYGIKGGFVFGYESGIANCLSGILLHLGYCREPSMESEAIDGNLQTCYDLFIYDFMREALKKASDHVPFCQTIFKTVRPYEKDNVKSRINEIFKNKSFLKNQNWIPAYKQLFKYIETMIPENLQGPLKEEQVLIYIEDDRNAEQNYIVDQINNIWRNQFIVKNISDTIIKYNVSEYDIFIFIGSMHINHIITPLKEKFGDIDITSPSELS